MSTTSLPQQYPQDQSLTEQDIARAQYDRKSHRSDYTKSSRYNFTIQLDMDDDFNPFYQVTIARKSGELIHEIRAFSTADAEAIVSSWWYQLECAETDTAMWGQL